jgi:hypothetical protein
MVRGGERMIIDRDRSGNEYFYEIILDDKESQFFRDQMDRRASCFCGFRGLHELPILGYGDHPGGWTIRGKKYWLYVHCPSCGWDGAIWKLGVKRE